MGFRRCSNISQFSFPLFLNVLQKCQTLGLSGYRWSCRTIKTHRRKLTAKMYDYPQCCRRCCINADSGPCHRELEFSRIKKQKQKNNKEEKRKNIKQEKIKDRTSNVVCLMFVCISFLTPPHPPTPKNKI